MRESVAVVGAGSWGTTLAKILGDNGVSVTLWTRREALCEEINTSRRNEAYLSGVNLPELICATTDLERVCTTSLLMILVVPSHGLRLLAREMGPYLTGEHVLVHAIKGIEEQGFRRMSELLGEETCVRKVGVLSGPNLAKELAQGQPAGTLVASRFDEVFQRAQAVLHNHYFRVYASRDVAGAEIGGAFKNIVAIAAGVVDGLGLGNNTKALLLTRGISEMARLGQAQGANALTFAGMAGMGDLMATCASPLSRNHSVGLRLAQGETLPDIQGSMRMVAEGVKTTRAVHAYAARIGLALPLVEAVHRVLFDGARVSEVGTTLMALPAGAEFEGFVS